MEKSIENQIQNQPLLSLNENNSRSVLALNGSLAILEFSQTPAPASSSPCRWCRLQRGCLRNSRLVSLSCLRAVGK